MLVHLSFKFSRGDENREGIFDPVGGMNVPIIKPFVSAPPPV